MTWGSMRACQHVMSSLGVCNLACSSMHFPANVHLERGEREMQAQGAGSGGEWEEGRRTYFQAKTKGEGHDDGPLGGLTSHRADLLTWFGVDELAVPTRGQMTSNFHAAPPGSGERSGKDGPALPPSM